MIEPLPASLRAPSHRAYWLCQFGGWGSYGLLQAYTSIVSLDASWARIVVEVFLLHASGLGLTHLLRGHMQRFQWSTFPPSRLLWRAALAVLVLTIPVGLANSFMTIGDMHDSWSNLASKGDFEAARRVSSLRISLQCANWAAVFAAWLSIYLIAVRWRDQGLGELRQSELARALQLAELRLLKSQLNPHFLFNAINTIRSLVTADPSRARDGLRPRPNS